MTEFKGRVFDRVPEFDVKNLDYLIRPLIAGIAEPITRFWDIQTWLDQLEEGACVGFAWTHDINAEPEMHNLDDGYARFVYREAKMIDEWEGHDYEGTSVLAGAKVVQKLGYMPEFRWAISVDDVLGALTTTGPVVLGLWWYEGMMETDENGYLHTWGQKVGGHAILAIGVDYEERAIRVHNSWGKEWGEDGHAWISFLDLDMLLRDQGEACVPMIRTPAHPLEPVEPAPEPEPQPPVEPKKSWFARAWEWFLDLLFGKDE